MKWIKCEDLPIPNIGKYLSINKEGDYAVVWYEDGYLIRGSWFGGCEFGCGGYDFFEYPKFWMPLPNPPEEL